MEKNWGDTPSATLIIHFISIKKSLANPMKNREKSYKIPSLLVFNENLHFFHKIQCCRYSKHSKWIKG